MSHNGFKRAGAAAGVVVATGAALLLGSGVAAAHVSAQVIGETAAQGGYAKITFRVPNGTLGQPYSHQFTAQGGGAGLTWSSLGSLPPGLTLSPAGLLSGTPTQAGDGWIDVAATDGTRYDWQGFLIAVAAPP